MELLKIEQIIKESIALYYFFRDLQLKLSKAINIFCNN